MNDQERLLTIFLRLQSGAHLSKTQLISKILLENRSLNKEENKALLDSLLAPISKDEQKEVSSIIASELLNYAPLSDTQNRIDKIWEWSEMIRKELVLDIEYQSPYNSKKHHTIFPVSLYYDTHYFYIVAYNLVFDSYMTLKLDRILSWVEIKEKKPPLSYGRKFRDGEIRNKRVDPFIGKELKIRVLFVNDPAIVIDQFSTAKIIEKTSTGNIIEFVSQDTPGLKRWLLSQAESLRVLSPQSLIDDMKTLIKKMEENYLD